jgi:hypothetical protein
MLGPYRFWFMRAKFTPLSRTGGLRAVDGHADWLLLNEFVVRSPIAVILQIQPAVENIHCF